MENVANISKENLQYSEEPKEIDQMGKEKRFQLVNKAVSSILKHEIMHLTGEKKYLQGIHPQFLLLAENKLAF